MEDSWITKGPDLNALISEKKDDRQIGQNKTAIIIPTFKRTNILREHLSKLSMQKFKQFDTIIIYGCDDDFLDETFGLDVVHIKRREDTGSAGGFYTGEKYCLEAGYDNIILADDDCLPESEELVGDLVSALERGSDLAFPRIVTDSSGKAAYNRIIAQYGALKTSILKKTGLSYLPFYLAGEDIELYYRICEAGGRISYVKSVAYHPPLPYYLTLEPARAFFYHRGNLLNSILRKKYGLVLFGTFFFLWSAVAIRFVNKSLSEAIWRAITEAVSLRLSLGITNADKTCNDVRFDRTGRLLVKCQAWEESQLTTKRSFAEMIMRMVFMVVFGLGRWLPRCFGKEIMIEGRLGWGEIPLLLVSKNAAWQEFRASRMISQNDYWVLSPLYMALVVLVAPVVAITSLMLVMFSIFNKNYLGIKSEQYGLTD